MDYFADPNHCLESLLYQTTSPISTQALVDALAFREGRESA
ncbi:hypothetical protein [Burkholderia sp. 22313]